ncbi:PEGA domain-containing protein [bacterium]|nr:PEGA domain-containing protein [bacterium]
MKIPKSPKVRTVKIPTFVLVLFGALAFAPAAFAQPTAPEAPTPIGDVRPYASGQGAAPIQVDQIFGAFTFARVRDDGSFENGYVEFEPDHTFTRVTHVDRDRDQVADDVIVTRGTFRVVAGDAESGAPHVALFGEDGARAGRVEAPAFRGREVAAFSLGGVSYTRKGANDPYFDAALAATPTGTLIVTTEPAGATVTLDGRTQAGSTPMTITDVPAGEHEVRARVPERPEQARTVTITKDVQTRAEFNLSKDRGELWIKTRPRVRVFVDGEYRGDTPAKIRDLAPGGHRVRFALPLIGMEREETIDVPIGRETRIKREFFGRLAIDVGRPVTAYATNGRAIGLSGGEIPLPVGRHVLTLKDAQGQERRAAVDIRLDETTALTTPFDALDVE